MTQGRRAYDATGSDILAVAETYSVTTVAPCFYSGKPSLRQRMEGMLQQKLA